MDFKDIVVDLQIFVVEFIRLYLILKLGREMGGCRQNLCSWENIFLIDIQIFVLVHHQHFCCWIYYYMVVFKIIVVNRTICGWFNKFGKKYCGCTSTILWFTFQCLWLCRKCYDWLQNCCGRFQHIVIDLCLWLWRISLNVSCIPNSKSIDFVILCAPNYDKYEYFLTQSARKYECYNQDKTQKC